MLLDELTALKEKAEIAVNLLKKMAHKDRLLILCHLVGGELSAGELSRLSLLSQSAFSQHLAILRNDNLVKTRKVSQTIYYSLADDNVIKVLEVLKQLYC
ncbi:ArsR/SmtB family transcription factor [Aquella oligotrophica]|jgi:DNA-binding transcriptional ArsR family regulator|uniref:Transcriptional regulator n=1 Tax=Aquella oligotrophica TaxID=2067065 RepID=A0A2I7N3U8_9NEIS|nr:metalloregulator ArsR/SmtB family transcription factor [Aquella oligotrophica]AUR51137.1 transcriptional regulator [Aquella oligotrophica]